MADKQSRGLDNNLEKFDKVTESAPDEGAKDVMITITADVSDMVTGLKAVQREAKAATVALRELERASKRTPVEINDLRDVQGQDGNWDYSEYMCGMFNGLELASATLEGRTPDYREIEVVRTEQVACNDAFYQFEDPGIKPDLVEISTKAYTDSYYDLSDVSTKELSQALAKREGVTEYVVAPHGDIANLYLADKESGGYVIIDGPARILVNKD